MAITLNWPAVTGTTGYKLYRQAGVRVDLGNLPSDAVTVAAGTNTYTYPTSAPNTLYYLVVASTGADGLVTYSDQIMIGYYPDTGPGPTQLMRGDWSFGFFGEVSVSDLGVSASDVYAAAYAKLGTAAVPPVNQWATLYKCVVAGRIVYIADISYTNSTTAPTVFITAGFLLPDWTYETNGIKINRNGFEFIARVPHATSGPLSALVPDVTKAVDDIGRSELGMMMALFGSSNSLPAVPAVPGNVSYAKYRLGDYSPTSYQSNIVTDTYATTTSVITGSNLSSGTVSTTATNSSTGRVNILLELLV